MSDAIRIGLPRTMLYHKYHVLWSAFFEGIGCETVVSPPSNKRLVDRGAYLSVDETCLSMKLFLGHVEALRGRADHVLVPTMFAPRRGEEACVKLHGAYDIARHSIEGISLISYVVDESHGLHEGRELVRLGRSLGAPLLRARCAYRDALKAHTAQMHEAAREQLSLLESDWDRPRVLLVGHAYNLYDEMIGAPIRRYLESLGVLVIDAEALSHGVPVDLHKHISVDVNWTYNKHLLAAVEHCRNRVDGVVFIVAFPCGPDSLMVELCHRRLKEVPIVTLVLDELSSATGLRTRLESFVDILTIARSGKDAASTPAGGVPQWQLRA